MRPLVGVISANVAVASGLSRLTIVAPSLATAQAGQWIAVRRAGSLRILAQPVPLCRFDLRAGSVEVLYEPDASEGADPWLAALSPGGAVDVLGPWGRPLRADARARHVLLVAHDMRLTRLLALAEALVSDGVSVVVLDDAATATRLFPPALLPAAVEYHVATHDGSAGIQGTVLDLVAPLLSWADALYAALDGSSYPLLRDQVYRGRLRARRGFATVFADAPLACYAGACDGCTVPLRDRTGLLCKDGPAFDLLELE